MQTEVVITLDTKIVQQAQQYAKIHGKSFSQLIADYLAILPIEEGQEREQQLPPITRSLRGILRHAELDEQTYHRYLEEKYL
ncbi:hypothetical protein U14_03833 [Candidatus Moduliflexus flocculans]|uniref:Antitoxin n=1 Tax=Candidatus Moduliflexus flocculans TaxID=1499966 RepID=A0A081BQB5_9BACT|nr:hypothetical protein U14_03833 [Candidatus Moduliflexus flocculans]